MTDHEYPEKPKLFLLSPETGEYEEHFIDIVPNDQYPVHSLSIGIEVTWEVRRFELPTGDYIEYNVPIETKIIPYD